jgi:DNA recombination protein RmuC
MSFDWVLTGIASALVAAALTYFFAMRKSQQLQSSLTEALLQANAKDQKLTELAQLVDKKETEVSALRDQLTEVRIQLGQKETDLKAREAAYAERRKDFEEQSKVMEDRFKTLAQEILEVKAKALTQVTQEKVVTPFKESLDSLKKELREAQAEETKQRTLLTAEIGHLKDLNQQITNEAHQLSVALRGQKKIQGNWGELVLENVLERSGLEKDKDYKREVSFNTDEGRQRPDVIVYLPQDRHLIIDAKVSLEAYTQAINSESEEDRINALNQHTNAIRARIKELADRDYTKIGELNSPEVVFMFVPIESAFVEAMRHDEQIFQEAIRRNILVATPTTLLTSLRIVGQLWHFENQNKHALEITSKAENIHKKLSTFVKSFVAINKSLDSAQKSYETAYAQLTSGKANLVKQVNDFKTLAPAIQSELPEKVVEDALLEVEYLPNVDEEVSEHEHQ